MDSKEMKDIIISILVLSFAFSNVMFKDIFNSFLDAFFISFLLVVFSFFVHEMAHRTVAKYYGYRAKYVSYPFGLLITLVSSFFGFIFAAPGAVYIQQRINFLESVRKISKKEMGIISLAGPLSNIIVGFLSFGVFLFSGFYIARYLSELSFWLSLFNLLPIPPLDGNKVYNWNKKYI